MNTEPVSAPAIRLLSVDFDCPDPAELARFCGSALDLPVVHSSDDFVLLGREGSPWLGFVRVADYRRPTWPDPSQGKQAHIELGVDDLEAAQARMPALGAVESPVQPQPRSAEGPAGPRGPPVLPFHIVLSVLGRR
jgi:hypothetical protein